MFKRISACAAAILLAVNPAFSQECLPLEKVAEALVAAEVSSERISTRKSEELPRAYARALGTEVPDDSDPIGLIMVMVGGGLRVHFVERQLCVRYSLTVPANEHIKAVKRLQQFMGKPA